MKQSTYKYLRKYLINVIIVFAFFSLAIIQLEQVNDWLFTQGPEHVNAFFSQFGLLALLFFTVLLIASNALFLPSQPFLLLAGILYGPVWGAVLLIVSSSLSAMVNFIAARYFGQGLSKQLHRQKKIKRILSWVNDHGMSMVFLLRYLGFSFATVSYAIGLTKIRCKPFILATAIGFLPYCIFYAYAGHTLATLESSVFVYPLMIFKVVLFATFIIGYWLVKLRQAKK